MGESQTQSEDWAGARKLVAHASTEMSAAEALATELGGATAAQGLAAGADDAVKIAEAAAELSKQAKAAQAEVPKDFAKDEFVQLFGSLDEALSQAKQGKLGVAATPLKGAAELLVLIKTMHSEHTRFEARHKLIDARAKLLEATTVPPKATIQGRIDPLRVALNDATAQDKLALWDKAGDALRLAEAAATEAELCAKLRKESDARAKKITEDAATMPDAVKDHVTDMVAKSTTAADAFNYDHANRFLDNAEARIAGGKIATMGPDDPELAGMIRKMLDAKGGEELLVRATDNPSQPRNPKPGAAKRIASGPELLDEIVKNLPDTVAPKLVATIAKERFGIDLYVSALYNEGGLVVERVKDDPADQDYVEDVGHLDFTKRGKSAKKLYEMLAKTPEQSRNNPSMARVERRDALKKHAVTGAATGDASSGGFYQSMGELVVMSGRPGDTMQQFGSALGQLPPAEPGYEPTDETPIDYFDYACVHETGHAVDDRLGFMASRSGQATFGGWQTYGGSISPIVTAVTNEHCGSFAAEFVDYLTDRMTGNTPDPPVAPEGEELAYAAAKLKLDEWHGIATGGQLWWVQADCAKVTIGGRIYQEAYKGTWVSYLASERGKGITGYQFRAPGEWFAELFAAYHCEKLKQGHPARKWLSSLSL